MCFDLLGGCENNVSALIVCSAIESKQIANLELRGDVLASAVGNTSDKRRDAGNGVNQHCSVNCTNLARFCQVEPYFTIGFLELQVQLCKAS